MSNPKAILFYLSFLPAFVDLTELTNLDVFIIIFVAVFTITPTMLACAWLTQKAKDLPNNYHGQSKFSVISAFLIIAVGLYMFFRSLVLFMT